MKEQSKWYEGKGNTSDKGLVMQVWLDRKNASYLSSGSKGEMVRGEVSVVGKEASRTIRVLVCHDKCMAFTSSDTESLQF